MRGAEAKTIHRWSFDHSLVVFQLVEVCRVTVNIYSRRFHVISLLSPLPCPKGDLAGACTLWACLTNIHFIETRVGPKSNVCQRNVCVCQHLERTVSIVYSMPIKKCRELPTLLPVMYIHYYNEAKGRGWGGRVLYVAYCYTYILCVNTIRKYNTTSMILDSYGHYGF